MPLLRIALSITLLFILFLSPTNSHTLPAGFASVQIADGLDPVDMAITPDGRVFLTEKSGRIRVIENGQMLLDPLVEVAVDNCQGHGVHVYL